MKVLLAWPAVNNLQLYNFVPIGLGYLAANIGPKHQVKIFDGVVEKYKDNLPMLDVVRDFAPDIVGISIWNFNLAPAQEMVAMLKEHFPQIPIAAGGPAVTSYAEKIFELAPIDFPIMGEGEVSFPKLLDLLEQKKAQGEQLKSIEGLVYKNGDGQVQKNPTWLGDLAPLKYCDYEAIRFREYVDKGYFYGPHRNSRVTAPLIATRGCPYPCEFCSSGFMNGKKIRTRPVESVIAEIVELKDKYGVDGFNFIDDNFTLRSEYAKEVARAIIALQLPRNISFCNPNGVRLCSLDQELLDLMKQANWETLFIAPESGSEATLLRMRKNQRLEEVEEKVALVKSSGLRVFGFFIIGYPGEGLIDIMKTIEFACRVPFDYVSLGAFQPLMGTVAYNRLVQSGEVEIAPRSVDYYQVTYAPKGMSMSEVKYFRTFGMVKFYFSSLERFLNVFRAYSLKRILVFAVKYFR